VIEFIKENSVVVIIIATGINVFFVVKNYLMNKKKLDRESAVIDIKLSNIPPYSGEDNRTVVTLKNVGNADSADQILVLVSCSWTSGISYKLNFTTPDTYFGINEEFSWKLELPGDPPTGSSIAVTVDPAKGPNFEYHEHI
jgi:hypothetical protein